MEGIHRYDPPWNIAASRLTVPTVFIQMLYLDNGCTESTSDSGFEQYWRERRVVVAAERRGVVGCIGGVKGMNTAGNEGVSVRRCMRGEVNHRR